MIDQIPSAHAEPSPANLAKKKRIKAVTPAEPKSVEAAPQPQSLPMTEVIAKSESTDTAPNTCSPLLKETAYKPPSQTVPTANPFDLNRLRLSQDFGGMAVKKALLTIPVRKPGKEWWIQTHPDPDYRLDTAVLELKEDNETYLVNPALWPELATESTFSPRALITAVTSTGICFLWPIRLPRSDGRNDDWSRSALEAASIASKGRWVRVQSNLTLQAYEVSISEYSKPPVWPELTLNELLQRAFKAKWIDTLEHPVLKRLRGEM